MFPPSPRRFWPPKRESSLSDEKEDRGSYRDREPTPTVCLKSRRGKGDPGDQRSVWVGVLGGTCRGDGLWTPVQRGPISSASPDTEWETGGSGVRMQNFDRKRGCAVDYGMWIGWRPRGRGGTRRRKDWIHRRSNFLYPSNPTVVWEESRPSSVN